MSSETAIKVENLSKCYQIYAQPHDRLKQSIYPRLQRLVGKQPKQYFREFWALKDVSFEIKKGETIGILGRNGSGKSTLLQMICGTLSPTSGSIQTHGRIAALLELGSGFNPEFTGRENVYMNATVLGLSEEEIDARYDDIVAFADIGDFIGQPVKTYSSGMMMRLAFSVQSQVDPDILIVDEALAVGDAAFQSKCYKRLEQLSDSGTTTLFVTHSMDDIQRVCSRGIVLNLGSKIIEAEPKRAIDVYKKIVFGDVTAREFNKSRYFSSQNKINPSYYSYGNEKAIIVEGGLMDHEGKHTETLVAGDRCTVYLKILANEQIQFPVYGFAIRDKYGLEICGTNSYFMNHKSEPIEKDGKCLASFSFTVSLNTGTYFLGLNCTGFVGERSVAYSRLAEIIVFDVYSESQMLGLFNMAPNMEVLHGVA